MTALASRAESVARLSKPLDRDSDQLSIALFVRSLDTNAVQEGRSRGQRQAISVSSFRSAMLYCLTTCDDQ